jgi:hypothetical protein
VILRGRLAAWLSVPSCCCRSQKLRPDKSRRVKNTNVGPNFSLIRYACRPVNADGCLAEPRVRDEQRFWIAFIIRHLELGHTRRSLRLGTSLLPFERLLKVLISNTSQLG